MADYPKFLEEVASVFNESSPNNDNVVKVMREAAVELRRLHAENASLLALAKFGKWCLSLPEDEFDDTALYSKAAEFGLIKFNAYAEAIETPLAQLPEK